MKRVLLTGMSGTGKSTLIREFRLRGYKSIDTDDGEWSHWVTSGESNESSAEQADPWQNRDWVWCEDRMHRLLATRDAEVLFVGGCAPNQAKFYPQFEHIVLLSAPTRVIVERLASRTSNAYGKTPAELARVLEHRRTVEPLLRRAAALEVDTNAPIEHVLQTILKFVET